ncbi:MAG TPA: PH domain-containing protein, partial [Opitutaceae bacterium]|nr:PH domain-containing protein [Opitutaceae bacterium]
MSYIRKHLMAGEVIAREARLSRILYLPAYALMGAALISLVVILNAGQPARAAMPLPAILVVIGLVLAIWGACRRASAEFAVTNKRVVVKKGLLRNHSTETLLRQIEGITVDQGIIGRIFNYGTIVIEGTGTDKVPYPQIADPMGLRLSVLEQID